MLIANRFLPILLFSIVAAVPTRSAALEPVVDADWVAAHRNDVTIIQTSRDMTRFDDLGHIEGAVFVAMADFLDSREIESGSVRYLVPSAEDFSRTLRELGVDDEDTIVIAPAGTGLYGDTTVAARFYWQLRYHGHDAATILDGGVAAWKAAGHPVVDRPASPGPGDFVARGPREELLRTTAEIADVIDASESVVLLDNRPLVQFAGLTGKDYVDGLGHLPGARPLPFNLFLVEREGVYRWRSADDVRRLYNAFGDSELPAVTYCNSGHVSALAWFALSEIGAIADVSLYDGSLHEWTQAFDRTLVVGR
jgi:thiosulfate/3-mercaptopyruvate sulfurtransferase